MPQTIDPTDPNAQFIADFIRSRPVSTTASPADAFAAYAVPSGDADPFAPYATPAVGEDVSHLMGDAPQGPAIGSGGALSTIESAIGDVATGALKGVGQTATNLGALVHKIPGVDTAVDAIYGKPGLSKAAFAAANDALAPTDAAQSVGKFGEQIAETFLPAGAAAEAAKGLSLAGRMGLEAAVNGGLGAAQTGSLGAGALAGALGAAIPGVGALAGKIAPALKHQAADQVVQALGPTAQRYKAMAARIAPEMLKRGLTGSREALQAQAAEQAASAGQKIDDALQAFGDRQVDTQPILAALEEAKNPFRAVTQQHISTVNPSTGAQILGVDKNGVADVLHTFDARPIQQLNGLQQIVAGLGPDARADQLVAVRRAWDSIVNQAGGYAQRAPGGIGLPIADQSEAWAKRQATTAIRQQLDQAVPELSSLNKEFSFWKNLDGVLTQTLQRTAPQKPGLGLAAAKAAGQVVGGVLGATSSGPIGAGLGAIAGGKLDLMLTKAFTSPAWKLASAQMKNKLATAIANNNIPEIGMALARITAVQGAKIPAAVAGQ